MMISPVSEFTTSSGIFSPSRMLLSASVNCSRSSSVLFLYSSSTCLACFFAEVRDVPRDFLGAKLRVPRAHFEFLDVNRSVDIILDDALADKDGVFEVVAVPWHERAEDVAAQGEFAARSARPVGNHLALLHGVAAGDQDLLVDARGRVRTHEFADRVHENARFGIVSDLLLALGELAVLRDNDLVAGDRRDLATFLRNDHRA